MAQANEAHWRPRPYEAGDLAGAFLAIAATDNEVVNQQVREEAQVTRVLLNVVDDPRALPTSSLRRWWSVAR